jgi:hypothetical protein
MTENGKTVSLSIIIPAKNEAAVIGDVVSSVRGIYADAEILVVQSKPALARRVATSSS